jgi:glycosyltransferase involved in cell wall biosynthesis
LRENANLVWTNSELESFELVIALKKRNPNLNTFIEMSEFLDIHHYNLGNVFQKKIADKRQYLFESKGIYAYNGFALMTKTLFNHYSNFKGSLPRLLHLPMTVDLERFSNATNDSISKTLLQPYIAFVGVMDNKKEGVSILIDAFAKVANHFPKLNLYLFGPYNYDTPGHLKQIEKLNLSEKIHYGGEINRNAIPSILLNAKLLVLPRPDSKQAQGGFPTKLGEYLASGKPVCATRVGEIPDYLIDNESVFFAEPGSVDSFADAISRSMNNPNQSIKVGLNGKKVAETYFNKDIQSKLLFDFLKQL